MPAEASSLKKSPRKKEIQKNMNVKRRRAQKGREILEEQKM